MTPPAPRAAILLSTFDGVRFLPTQLESLRAQTVTPWRLFWRDDGSSDGTQAAMAAFAAELDPGQFVPVDAPGRLGACASFLALLRAAEPLGVPVAFADQDDLWVPEKLDWAMAALRDAPGPALYCSRQLLVDERLRPLSLSPPLSKPPGFPAALAQNVVTGCTAVLNPQAVRLVTLSRPPPGTMHDWWSYLVVSAAGGRIIADTRASLLYRQHPANLVGAPASLRTRATAALRRGPRAFMTLLRAHVAALLATPELLAPASLAALERLDRALASGAVGRLGALRARGLCRQTWLETVLFRLWFLVG